MGSYSLSSEFKLTDGTCSFCHSNAPVVQKAPGLAVCPACSYSFLVAQDKIPFGAIYCFSCKNFDTFTVSRKTSKASFRLNGIDTHDAAVYIVATCKGEYERLTPILHIECGHCKKRIPNWMGLANSCVTP